MVQRVSCYTIHYSLWLHNNAADDMTCYNHSSVSIVEILKGKKTDTFGYVAYDSTHNAVIVSFRGTVSLVNWIEDLKFWKVDHTFDNVTTARVAKGKTTYHHIRTTDNDVVGAVDK
jgi:hypothetical protein